MEDSGQQKSLEEFFTEHHKEILEECEEAGIEHGRAEIPGVAAESTDPFESLIRGKYQKQIEELFAERRRTLDTIYDQKYSRIKEQLDELLSKPEVLQGRLKKAEEERDRQIQVREDIHVENQRNIGRDAAWTNVKKQHQDAERRLEDVASEVGRDRPFIQFRPFWFYVLVLIFIGICEIPLNYQVFKSFREIPLLTLIMAGTLVITLPLLAHSCGLFIKQRKEKPEYIYFGFAGLIIVLSLSYLTAYLRTEYIAARSMDAVLVSRHIDIMTFFVISVLLFFVGMISSYFAHDESHSLTVVYGEYLRVERRYRQKQAEIDRKFQIEDQDYMKEKEKILLNFTNKKGEIEGEVERLRTLLKENAAVYDGNLHSLKGFERQINQNHKIAIFHYRDVNLKHRLNHQQPISWKELEDLELRFHGISELSKNPI